MKIVIHNKEFKSIKDAKQYVRNILNNNALYTPLSKDEFDFMLSVMQMHERAAEKIGVGVVSIDIQINHPYTTRGFYATRKDCSVTDFSYIACLSGNKDKSLPNFKRACRHSVDDYVVKFKKEYFLCDFDHICPISGELLTPGNSHVDHAPPYEFEDIVRDFIKNNNIDVKKVSLKKGDGVIKHIFLDKELDKSFFDFHKEKANLRVILDKENLKRGYSNKKH